MPMVVSSRKAADAAGKEKKIQGKTWRQWKSEEKERAERSKKKSITRKFGVISSTYCIKEISRLLRNVHSPHKTSLYQTAKTEIFLDDDIIDGSHDESNL